MNQPLRGHSEKKNKSKKQREKRHGQKS